MNQFDSPGRPAGAPEAEAAPPERAVFRRRALGSVALAASLSPLLARRAGAQGPSTQAAPPKPPPRPPQGGRGPIQVLLVTKGHEFDREPFYFMFDQLGKEITYTHVEHPAAQVFFDPALAEPYDVFVFYDMAGRGRRVRPDGTAETYDIDPSPALRKNFRALLQKGQGMVFWHHAIASWVHTWPEYVEAMGGAADWGRPLKNIRGKEYPYSGYRQNVPQRFAAVDKTHPVLEGLGDGFEMVDEPYLCPIFEDSVHPLLRTDFKPVDENFPMQYAKGWRHPPGSNLAAWVKTAERSPIVYLQPGHDRTAYENPELMRLMLNSIRWAASKEARAWAAAKPTKIFQ